MTKRQRLTIEFMDKMKECKRDKTNGHIKADNALCDLLAEIGYKSVVKAYRDVEKWY